MFTSDEATFIDYLAVFWLDKMRHAYHANGVKLAILLEVFEWARCSDVRDKVYGLAIDAADLVIDYSKSPLDLYADLVLLGGKSGVRENVIFSARYLQRLSEGQVETPPIDSLYSSSISVVAKVYEAGIISYVGPIPDWDRVELKHHYRTELLQVMKLEGCNPLTVLPISSNIAYAVKESKACQDAVKTNKDLTTERALKSIRPISSIDDTTIIIGAESTTSTLEESESLLFADEMGHIGIAPSNARVSDTICRTENLGPNRTVAVVLRKTNGHYIVIGRAVFPDIQGEHLRHREADHFNLHLYIRTLQLLTKSSRTGGPDFNMMEMTEDI